MSKTAKPAELNTCGCCETGVEEPVHENRPGLPNLNYRIGTHGTFLRRMLAQLARQEIPDGENRGRRPLAALTTRSTADPAIALLDAWATVADVLTFYQERIANEGFLRTATERRSVLELARAIGYELNPGVAASTYLAFTVDESDSTPDTAIIPAGTQVQSIPAKEGELPQTFETAETFEARAAWNVLLPQQTVPHPIAVGTKHLYLKGINLQLAPGDAILIVGPEREGDPSNENWDVRQLKVVEEFPEANYTLVTWDEGLGWRRFGRQVTPAAETTAHVYVFRQQAALFGYNAPDWRTMSADVKRAYKPDLDPDDRSTWGDEWPGFEEAVDTASRQADLDAVYPKIVEESWLVLEHPGYMELYQVEAVTKAARSDFAVTAKTTRVTLKGENLSRFTGHRRDTVVYAQPEELERAEKPLAAPVEGNTIELDRRVEGLAEGQPLIVSGKLAPEDEEETREVAFVKMTVDGGNRTTVVLQKALEHRYVRTTVKIYANVVLATHGETVADEVLGSGDGAQAHQQFTLKRSPLTHISAETATGNKSTLEVRVNGVLWEPASSLYGLPASAEKYIVRINNEAEASVIFGDGKHGARLPTGQENVRATYRFGIGSEGEVGAGALSLLKKRPFGVRRVTNPLPASGAADPEKLENARTNAPLTVLTLDRVVSLQDFEDFARAFAGIGKAQAVSVWNGEDYLVHITVADDDGDPASEDLRQKLSRAIDDARDPNVVVQLDNYERLTFNVEAGVQFDKRYLAEDVQAQIEQALLDAFSFDQRAFGQPVTAAELLSAVQQVEGVIAVDLDALYLEGEPKPAQPPAVLPARTARRESGQIRPGQLLLINPDGIQLTLRAT